MAYHFRWPHDQIMGLDHRARQQWVAQIARINQTLNDQMTQV